jgi:hypothetical protein
MTQNRIMESILLYFTPKGNYGIRDPLVVVVARRNYGYYNTIIPSGVFRKLGNSVSIILSPAINTDTVLPQFGGAS